MYYFRGDSVKEINNDNTTNMDSFLDELKATTTIALSAYKNKVFTRDYPTRELYNDESEYRLVNLELTLAYIEKIKHERDKKINEILDIYYKVLDEVRQAKYNKEEEKYVLVDSIFDIKKVIGGLILFRKNKKKIQSIDKSIMDADNLEDKINEMINWLIDDNEAFNMVLNNLKERAISGEDILWKLLNLTMPLEEDTIENDRKKIPIVKKI